MSQPPFPLNYSPTRKPILTRRRWFALVAFMVTIGLAAAFERGWWQMAKKSWQFYQCCRFSLPANTVIYEDDPTVVGNLIGTGRYTSGSRHWDRTAALLPSQEFYAYVGGSQKPEPVVFMHELISPAGHRRLVMVQFGSNKSDPMNRISFDAYEEGPTPGVPAPLAKRKRLEMYRAPAETVTLYAGQIDPQDASHFTIDYKLNGLRETIDGWLFDDDTVRLMPRCGDIVYMSDGGIWRPGNGMFGNWVYQLGLTTLGHTNAAPTSRPSSTVPAPIAASRAR